MSYKDPEKQREYQREKQRKYRERRSGNAVVTEVVTRPPVVTHGAVTPGLHTKDDVNPWGWPKYDSQDRRINPATMEPYGLGMAGLPAEALCEYERKRVREDILVISELPREQVDWLYRCMLTH